MEETLPPSLCPSTQHSIGMLSTRRPRYRHCVLPAIPEPEEGRMGRRGRERLGLSDRAECGGAGKIRGARVNLKMGALHFQALSLPAAQVPLLKCYQLLIRGRTIEFIANLIVDRNSPGCRQGLGGWTQWEDGKSWRQMWRREKDGQSQGVPEEEEQERWRRSRGGGTEQEATGHRMGAGSRAPEGAASRTED